MAEQQMGDPLGANAVRRLLRDMGSIPNDLRKRLRTPMRRAAQPILADARARASWSSRIPRSLGLRTNFTRKHAGVSIVARRSIAPHARPYEGITGNTYFRHPVGGRDVWVQQSTRPFLQPAVDMHARSVVRAVDQVVNQVAKEAGFKR